MKLVLATTALFLVNVEDCFAQQVADSLNLTPNIGVVASVDNSPEFPGGPSAMLQFIEKSYDVPGSAKRDGKIHVGFVVKSDGSLSDVMIKRGLTPILNNEALRVVRTMPRWKPARKDGHAIDILMTLPIKIQ